MPTSHLIRRLARCGALSLLALCLLIGPALAQDDSDQSGSDSGAAPTSDTSGATSPDQATTPAALPSAAPTVAAPGQILLNDSFQNPSQGVLPTSSTTPGSLIVPPGSFSLGYVSGAYEMKKVATQDARASVLLPGSYGDEALDVDVQFLASATDTWMWLTCRQSSTGGSDSYYLATIWPDRNQFSLGRVDSQVPNGNLQLETPALLLPNTPANLARSPAMNHLEYVCAGNTISLAVNGTVVGSVQDSAYATGSLRIGTAATGGAPDTLHLMNLAVTQR